MKLLKWLRHLSLSQRLPRIPRTYSTEYDSRAIDHDTSNLMRMTATRCPQGVDLLKRKHRAAAARDLVYGLPLQKPRRQNKLIPWIRGVFGTLGYNPMMRYAPRNRSKRFSR